MSARAWVLALARARSTVVGLFSCKQSDIAEIRVLFVVVNLDKIGPNVIQMQFAEVVSDRRQICLHLASRWNEVKALGAEDRAIHGGSGTSGYSAGD